jgi:hypothetical protein
MLLMCLSAYCRAGEIKPLNRYGTRELPSTFVVPHLYLAGAYGLQGDLEAAKSALTESMRLKPTIRSLAGMRAENPWLTNPQYWVLQEKTLNVGLRRAGLPDQWSAEVSR